MDEITKDCIKSAKHYLERYDSHMANFILRDCPVVRGDEGLSELSWAMHRETPSMNDVLFLIERIEEKENDRNKRII